MGPAAPLCTACLAQCISDVLANPTPPWNVTLQVHSFLAEADAAAPAGPPAPGAQSVGLPRSTGGVVELTGALDGDHLALLMSSECSTTFSTCVTFFN